ncbi:hypothetical protein Nmel_009642 [Mimus melanotis]
MLWFFCTGKKKTKTQTQRKSWRVLCFLRAGLSFPCSSMADRGPRTDAGRFSFVSSLIPAGMNSPGPSTSHFPVLLFLPGWDGHY